MNTVRPDVQPLELIEHPRRVVAMVRSVRMLGVEGQGDARSLAHFSTPVITMPRMKKRWPRKKMIIGITIVISVAAWTSCTCCEY